MFILWLLQLLEAVQPYQPTSFLLENHLNLKWSLQDLSPVLSKLTISINGDDVFSKLVLATIL